MNPNGRPKGSKNKNTLSLRELAEPHGPKAIKYLIKHMKDKNPAISISAANSLLDRGYGKPVQAVESKSVVLIADVSPLEIARKAAYLLDNAPRIEANKAIEAPVIQDSQ